VPTASPDLPTTKIIVEPNFVKISCKKNFKKLLRFPPGVATPSGKAEFEDSGGRIRLTGVGEFGYCSWQLHNLPSLVPFLVLYL
jgi:hypothetical protein